MKPNDYSFEIVAGFIIVFALVGFVGAIVTFVNILKEVIY